MAPEPKGWRIDVPWKAEPKARPKFNSDTKKAYMPKPYAEWKERVAEFIGYQNLPILQGPVGLDVTFRKTGFVVVASEVQIKRFGQADLDNLLGGVMDAIQDGRGYMNDRQVAAARAQFFKE